VTSPRRSPGHSHGRRARRSTAAAALALLVPALAACGFNPQTDQVYQGATGVNERGEGIDVLNALIVSDEDGRGTFAGTLVNLDADNDRLVSITDASGTVDVAVPTGEAVNLGATGEVRLEGAQIKPGAFVPLTLQFAGGQTTKLGVPVVAHRGEFVDVPVGPTATPSPKAKKAKQPGAEETPSATDTASPAE
jgi:hypothetical protein